MKVRIAAALIAVVFVAFVAYGAVDRMYLSPRAELNEKLENASSTVATYRDALDRRPAMQERLQSYVDRTLGGDIETVDHRLRTRMNRLAEQLELQSISVTTGSPRALGSPARGMFRGAALRDLRDELDFVEVPGSITVEGALMQVVELIDRIEAEPWLKQVYDINIDPRDNGRRFTARVRLRTLFLPGRAPETEPRGSYDRQRLARLEQVGQDNPFRLPPPPEPEPEPQPEPQQAERPSPPPFPYHQWVLTGVAEGHGGAEVWLRNRRSGESRRIEVGEGISQLVFIGARGDSAEFEHDDQRFLIAVGASLNDRTPLNR